MKALRSSSPVVGIVCLVIGSIAAMNDGGTVAATTALGHMWIIAGAIIIAAVLISSAITDSNRKE